ncbi:hypothetical protein GEV33_012467 [Tenebrio molitor]|uniref:Uncharacterized protein n=1 Tax=Tenebrio molitor TaxID=7067 RepID=A0A8J6L3G9_TENMO|nr:hypothetical protein GEV33_012467 [Tenebrio molitor]
MSRVEKAKGIYRVEVQRERVPGLTNPTVCSYHLAEIARKKAPFQLPHQLEPNMKNEEKPTRKTQREGKAERRINDNGKRMG